MQKQSAITSVQARDTGVAMVLLALLAAWLTGEWSLAGLALLLLVLAFICPGLFRLLTGPWLALSRVLGEISSRMILTLLFFLVVTPVGLLRRLVGADPLQLRRWRDGDDSVLLRREHRYRAEDLEKPY